MVNIVFCMSEGEYIGIKNAFEKDSLIYMVGHEDTIMLLDSFLSNVIQHKNDPVGIRLLLSYKGTTQLIDLQKIIYIEMRKRVVEVHVTGNNKIYKAYAPMIRLEQVLTELGFVRVSRFVLAAIPYIEQVCENRILFSTGEQISLGQVYRDSFFQRIQDEPHIRIKRENI